MQRMRALAVCVFVTWANFLCVFIVFSWQGGRRVLLFKMGTLGKPRWQWNMSPLEDQIHIGTPGHSQIKL